jgi:CRP-like cAMP-binding protein
VEFDLLTTNQELAAQIGTVRELVSRNLSRLQAQDLIRVEGRKIIIHDPKALQAELQSRE